MIDGLRSFYWSTILRSRGARVGRNFSVGGSIKIKCRDGASLRNLHIGNDVSFSGTTTYLRLRANGRIYIADHVILGTEVWLVTANDALLRIGERTEIGSYSILNGGHGIDIGKNCWFAGFVYLNSSDHAIKSGRLIREQGFIGAPIRIGNDNWFGGQVFINKGITTGNGVVVGAGSVVTKSFPDNAVVVGNPARILKFRQ
jgi:acetyltransferase-like isoleucine patch superfamily enzyme